MNQQCTNNGSFSGELHQPKGLADAPEVVLNIVLLFARSKNTLSSLHCFEPERVVRRPAELIPVLVQLGHLRGLIYSSTKGRRMPENLHPLYGKSSADLQPGRTQLYIIGGHYRV
jgi:hypothetical protein